MNIALDERTKHRLTGLVVIMAIAIIFVPAMLKKSNQRLEENIHVAVQLPPKPAAPQIAAVEEDVIFETVKVEKVALPGPIKPKPASQIARAEPLTPKPIEIAKPLKKKHAPQLTKIEQPPSAQTIQEPQTTEAYMVQLAAFNVQKNAEKLVLKLREKGYKAQYHTTQTPQGIASYKVTVGQLNDHADARQLKNKLIESTKLEGFIVKREMS